MSPEVISILVLGLIFMVATLLPVNIGVLAFAAAFLVGRWLPDQSTDDIIAGFPSELFLTLVGITYLFAVALHAGGSATPRSRVTAAPALARRSRSLVLSIRWLGAARPTGCSPPGP